MVRLWFLDGTWMMIKQEDLHWWEMNPDLYWAEIIEVDKEGNWKR